jgi:hypothetical protein
MNQFPAEMPTSETPNVILVSSADSCYNDALKGVYYDEDEFFDYTS